MNLAVALGTVGEEGLLQCLALADVGQERLVVERGAGAVARVASHAEEGRGLAEKVVLHGPVRLMTDRAILSHRGVFVDKRPHFLLVAADAYQIDARLLQEPQGLPMRVMTVAADHFAFEDGVV